MALFDLLRRGHQLLLLAFIYCGLLVLLAADRHRVKFRGRLCSWQGSVAVVLASWQERTPHAPHPPRPRAGGWNRTPPQLEERVVRLHVEQPLLGAGQLRHLARRVCQFHGCRETVRKILIRNKELIIRLEREKRRGRRHIRVARARELWGADLTHVWLLGLFPVWILGVVDYHGSRVIAFERLAAPTSAEIARVLSAAIAREGAPERILTDNGSVFSAPLVAEVLELHEVKHSLTRPAHPWTNGRIERLNRTFKETVFALVWLIASRKQLDRFCADFVRWHNRDRPHSSWGGRTPDEVYFDRDVVRRPLGRVEYFDGLLSWYRFG